ncbi:MAG: serine/threonine-protein phosphatase [Chlamydiia bacterium]|nr:serine/threonine-protein phosphatase [Chlamydiia bacterium]
MPLTFRACGISETGLVREGNEDAWGELPEYQFYVLADGMGGHQAGEVASAETVRILKDMMAEVLSERSQGRSPKDLGIMLRLAIVETNRRVFKMAQEAPELKGMGTTLCCIALHGYHLVYAHLGDSRIYRLRDGHLQQLTCDHSLYRQMIDRGQVDEGDPQLQSYKNIVTKCIGTGWLVDPTVAIDAVLPGDWIMMCSDGLTDMVSNQQIEHLMNDWPTPREACHALVEAALMNGGVDNVTVVVAAIEEGENADGDSS